MQPQGMIKWGGLFLCHCVIRTTELLYASTTILCSENVDYASVGITVSFGTGMENTQCFNITILDDTVFESQEGFFLALLPIDDFIAAGITRSSVFIIDNESMSFIVACCSLFNPLTLCSWAIWGILPLW